MTKESSKSEMTDQTALSYGFGKTTLGKILVATSDKGVVSILIDGSKAKFRNNSPPEESAGRYETPSPASNAGLPSSSGGGETGNPSGRGKQNTDAVEESRRFAERTGQHHRQNQDLLRQNQEFQRKIADAEKLAAEDQEDPGSGTPVGGVPDSTNSRKPPSTDGSTGAENRAILSEAGKEQPETRR